MLRGRFGGDGELIRFAFKRERRLLFLPASTNSRMVDIKRGLAIAWMMVFPVHSDLFTNVEDILALVTSMSFAIMC